MGGNTTHPLTVREIIRESAPSESGFELGNPVVAEQATALCHTIRNFERRTLPSKDYVCQSREITGSPAKTMPAEAKPLARENHRGRK